MSNFDFLTTEWNEIYAAASKAESTAILMHARSVFTLDGLLTWQ